MDKLKLEGVKNIAQGHTAPKGQTGIPTWSLPPNALGSRVISIQLQVQQVGGKHDFLIMPSNIQVLEFTLTRLAWIQPLVWVGEKGVTQQNQNDITRIREYECQ